MIWDGQNIKMSKILELLIFSQGSIILNIPNK